MATAIIIYALTTMAVAALAVHRYRQYKTVGSSVPRQVLFYISLLRFVAILMFVILAYPVLLGMSESPSLNNDLMAAPGFTMGLIMVLACGTLLALFCASGLPVPVTLMLQAIIVITWVSKRIGAVRGFEVASLPPWQFLGASMVLYGSCLLISYLFLWLPREPKPGEQRLNFLEMIHMFAVLPALLIYALGLGSDL